MTGTSALRGALSGALILVLTGAGVGAEDANGPVNYVPEKKVISALRVLATAQADFRANDRDGNRVQDYWTGDIAGLYYLTSAAVKGNKDAPIKLIAPELAAADAGPLKPGAAGGEYAAIGTPAQSGFHPYRFRIMTADASVEPTVMYQADTDGRGLPIHNSSRFGFCAYPARYHGAGRRTLIINENNVIFAKKTGGKPVLTWPSDREIALEWTRVK